MSNKSDQKEVKACTNPKFAELYPERGGKACSISKFKEARGVRDTIIRNCEESVVECFENVPYLKLLWESMQSMGCKVDLSRNISCELCQNGYDLQHQGNYDEDKNQVKFLFLHT